MRRITPLDSGLGRFPAVSPDWTVAALGDDFGPALLPPVPQQPEVAAVPQDPRPPERHDDSANRRLAELTYLTISLEAEIAEHRRIEAELREREQHAKLAADVGAALAVGDTVRSTLQRCAEALVQQLDAAFARVWTLNEADQVLELQSSAGMYTHIDGAHGRVPVGQFKIGRIAQSARPHLSNNVPDDPEVGDHEWARREGMVAFAGYPLLVENRVIGVIAAFARHLFSPATLDAFSLVTNEIAQFIERRRAEEELREAHADLEARVAARTAELARANATLEAEVADRKRAEQAALESESILRSFYDSAPMSMGVIEVLDSDSRFVSINAGTARFLGIRTEAMQGQRAEEMSFPPEVFAIMQEHAEAAEHSDQPICFEYAYPLAGGPRNLSLTFSRIGRNAAGRMLVSFVAEDITERHRAAQRTLRQVERMTAVRAVDEAITASLDLRVALGTVIDQLTLQLKADAAAVLLYDPVTQSLQQTLGRGFRTVAMPQVRLGVASTLLGQAVLKRQPLRFTDLNAAPSSFTRAELAQAEGFLAYHAVPLVAKGQLKGVLEVFHRAVFEPDADWLDFLDTLAGQAAIAIDNASLFENLERSNAELTLAYDQTIEGWSHALDLRDHETEGHTQRVTEMTLHLARHMGISPAELVHIRRGALLHDIGKMGIPDNVLLKPDALTDEEWTIMRRHPVYALEMLSPIAFLRPALDIPYCHHEKWDGTGYPRGLKGEQIPLSARIFAVVDVWDALRSDRPYRKGWADDQIHDHIRSLAGTHLDPTVVGEFFRALESSAIPRAALSALPAPASRYEPGCPESCPAPG